MENAVLTLADLISEILQERGRALDVVELEDAFEDLVVKGQLKHRGMQEGTYDLVFLGSPMNHDGGIGRCCCCWSISERFHGQIRERLYSF